MTRDSTPHALEVQREVWRRMGPSARVRLAIEMSEEMRRIALAGARSRAPGRTYAALRREQLRAIHGLEGRADPGS